MPRWKGCGSRCLRTASNMSNATRPRSGPGSTRSPIGAWPRRRGPTRTRRCGREGPHPRHRHHRRRAVQGLRHVHPGLPARRADDEPRGQRPGLPVPDPPSRLHRLPGLPADLPRLGVRGLPVRGADRAGGAVPVTRRLMEGSEAIVEAGIAAGCRFFTGYPMTPFTEVLEHFSRRLPEVGGVCINAESELEAIGMTWGSAATGARAATGSVGQGLSLMQESLAEAALARVPMVIFNMSRGQSDYFQATRGGGHGDYRTIVLAPMDVSEAVELTQLAFHLADKWRNPVLVYGDFLIAHTSEAIDVQPIDFGPLPEKDWAIDGSTSGTGRSRMVTSIGIGKAHSPGGGIIAHFEGIAPHLAAMQEAEQRVETGFVDDA